MCHLIVQKRGCQLLISISFRKFIPLVGPFNSTIAMQMTSTLPGGKWFKTSIIIATTLTKMKCVKLIKLKIKS